MVDRVQTSEINHSADINGVVQKSLSIYLKWQKAQRAVFIQTVRRGSCMRSVQCCTKWLVLVTVCVCVWGGGQSSVVRGVREGRGGKVRSSASWQPDGWSCPSVCWSWPGESAVSSLMAADWRSCVSGGWDHLQCRGLCGWDGCCRCPGGRGERDTNNLLSCSHYPLEGLAVGRVAGAIPHSDAAGQDALDGASVEGAHDGGRGSGSSEFAEEVETLLCFLGQCCSVVSPGEVLCDVYTQELGAAHSPQSHHWWSEEHAECALSWSQQQSPSSSPHSERDCCHCTTRPGGSPRSCSLSHLCCWWDPPQSCHPQI